jgi:Uma2 family endonuclease
MSSASDLRLTIADLESMPDDGNRYELIDGELYVSTAPSLVHQTILMNIAAAFLDYLREHPVGRIVPGVGVIFDDYNGVIPDLVFATNEAMRKAQAVGRFDAAPEIIIEILSPGASNVRRDRHVKRSLYAARGAGEYWIVDPKNRSVEVHRRDEAGNLVFEKSFGQGDEITCVLLAGFSARVDAFFV